MKVKRIYRASIIVLLILFVFALSNNAKAQNLVPNFSFEKKAKCPPDFVSFYREIYVSNWESANIGTPDYFNACANKCGVPLNWVGSSDAFHGDAYMGIIACMQQYDDRQVSYREYIQVKLSDSLQAGKQYYASFQVKLGLSCIGSCNGLGILFSEQKLRSDRNTVYPFRPQIVLRDEQPIKEKESWTEICGYYTAMGGEAFLIIGNFLSNTRVNYFEFPEHTIVTKAISPMAYYYIDNVEVYEMNDTVTFSCANVIDVESEAFDGSLPEYGKVVLQNLYFDFDKDVILPSSYAELNQLALLLKAKPNIKIRLYGHTDEQGDLNYNQTLSEKRANAVRYYLIGKGVSRMRIESKGYGSTMPVASNLSDEGRKKNRRVELEIMNGF